MFNDIFTSYPFKNYQNPKRNNNTKRLKSETKPFSVLLIFSLAGAKRT